MFSALGGVSAGGGLAATLSHMLVNQPSVPEGFKLRFLQLIIVSFRISAKHGRAAKQWRTADCRCDNE
jgi:hypothetical protein